MEEEKGHPIDEHEKKDSEDESEIQSLVEDKTQISIDNNPDRKFKPAEFKKTVKKNPWVMATIVLGIIALVLLVLMLRGGITGNIITGRVIGEGDISSKTVDFVNTNLLPPGQGQVTFNSINEKSGLYEVLVNFQGREVPIYVTKDGEFMTQALIPMNELNQTQQQTQPSSDVPKSDKPKVELFVMTHCPYGTQAEKGIVPVFELLDDKIDSSIKFVHYFLHDPEEEETPLQVCIREEQSDKFLDYLKCFLADGDSDRCLTETVIDKTELDLCIVGKADDYYAADSELSEGYGVRGSPTLVVNGVIADSGRSPAAYLGTICSAFNNAPEECNEVLNTANPSAGFGYTASAGGSTNAQC